MSCSDKCQAACAACGRAFIAEEWQRRIGGWAHVLAEHTQVLARRGETCRWMSAAALGDWVLASNKL